MEAHGHYTWWQLVNDTKLSEEDMSMPSWGDQTRLPRGKNIIRGPRTMKRVWIVGGGIEGKLGKGKQESRQIVS